MSRIDVSELSFEGTWIDGYIPKLKDMKKLSRLYKDLDAGGDYGFSQASGVWLPEDFFAQIASAIRDDFHDKSLSPDDQLVPCLMWLIQTDKEPSDPKLLPLYEEYQVDPRKEDYYHLVTIHRECPIREGCLQQVIKNLHFESKLQTAYSDPERFTTAVQEALNYYVNIMSAPWGEVLKHLRTMSGNIHPISP
jgi:hypothetical protein